LLGKKQIGKQKKGHAIVHMHEKLEQNWTGKDPEQHCCDL
jgi:hypothetical protein